ncbi:MAG: hypothetical protein WC099_01250 [Candidatus Paceibacterota bacterium]
MDSNPGTFNQAQKLLELFNPLSNEREKLQKLFGSGFISDLVKSFVIGNGDEISRNELRKVVNLPFYQNVEMAKKILGENHVLYKKPLSSENIRSLNYDLIPYFKETLLWAKDQNEKEGRDIRLIEIPENDSGEEYTFPQIQEDIISQDDTILSSLYKRDKSEAEGLRRVFDLKDFYRKWKGYYLIDFSKRGVDLVEKQDGEIERLSIPASCLMLYFLGKYFSLEERNWFYHSIQYPSGKSTAIDISFVRGRLSVKILEDVVYDASFLKKCDQDKMYLIKRDVY